MLPIIHGVSHSKHARSGMPQIDDVKAFMRWLRRQGVNHQTRMINPQALKATQNEINLEHVFEIIASGFDNHRTIIACTDNHIFDGHHRWYAALILREHIHVVLVDCNINHLLKLVHKYNAAYSVSITEHDRPKLNYQV